MLEYIKLLLDSNPAVFYCLIIQNKYKTTSVLVQHPPLCLTDVVFLVILSVIKYYLHMDGRGNYDFKPITEETVEFGS